MHVKLIPVAAAADRDVFEGTTAVVFDVLRATSTIVTALAAGYRRIYPVAEESAALALAHKHGYALAGERGGRKIPGFPHGNSPLEFWPGDGKESEALVLTTSNGTGAIQMASGAARVLTGSLLNARAAALAALKEGRDILLVCAGTGGAFSLEDALGAGFVLAELIRATGETPPMDDLAMAAYRLSIFYGNDPLGGLLDSRHGQRLLALECEDDLRWCAQLNKFNIAPVFMHDHIYVP
ncbi:2-phosphosulfolactate phosphatase [Desulfallas sp. Bu1-1]|uniref:2-phosphosulfolactate phosphatase n=1 Tax=Desulfallas sp. Bu1-1 TaxID=2787620 RepID=UPI00189CD219|nr:2-phosphosulfolactate phosphatase [Desulfallas sp. Bu1-1]MBF7081997.1 2-phosphosulfolactate phosphatase [Desulfallas sp. Bu1-1]